MLPQDIRQRIEIDFGPEAERIYRHLLERIPEGLPNGTRARHLRCILYLAAGNEAALNRAIETCLQDTRDVMLAAEYDTTQVDDMPRLRDFSKPFDQAHLVDEE
jgi:hypothetical protein